MRSIKNMNNSYFKKKHIPWNKNKKIDISKYLEYGMSNKKHQEVSIAEMSVTLKKQFKNGRKVWNDGLKGYTVKTKYKTRKDKGSKRSEETKNKIKIARQKQVLPTKDTSIEIKIQKELEKRKIVFEKHKPIIGQPDIFIEPNICIFADGDYWHNRSEAKKRDEYVNKKLKEQNYQILRFWEHEINESAEKCIDKIRQLENGNTN